MSLFFWIAVGIALGALVLGLILKARLSDEQVWEELVDPNAPSHKRQSKDRWDTNADARDRYDISMDSEEHPVPQRKKVPEGEEMNTPPLTQNRRSSRDADLRRSTRVERPVPLVVLGTNRRGEVFQERTSALSVNLHGCRYSSRHDYANEGWVTLQVTGTDGANSRPIRARVRSVFSGQSPRELCQVGVELETPGNIWGIPAPPEDWQRILGSGNSGMRAATGASPAIDHSASSPAFFEKQPAPTERRAEVTVFPGPSATAAAAAAVDAAPGAETSPTKEPAPSKAERVVVTAEQLLQALQGKIQLAADKAVQASLSTQIESAIKTALGKIEDGWRANARQTEDFSAARLAEVQSLWEKELVVYRARAEEIARRLEVLASNSQQALVETQKIAERFTKETAPQLHARLNDSVARANSEFETKAAQLSQHHLAQLAESTQLASREARSQLDEALAEVRSLLSSAAAGVSQERVEALIRSSKEQTFGRLEERLSELQSGFEQKHELARHRTNEVASQLENLALETRVARSQHEQGLAEIRSLLATTDSGVSEERVEALIHSAQEQSFSRFEERLGQLYSAFEQQHDLARQHTEEVARQLESFAAETRQARSQHEQGFVEVRSRLANVNAGVPQERVDSLLNSSREQILNHLEWRLGEISGHYEQLLSQVRNQADELAQQVEKLSAETRGQLAETRSLAERASRELQPQDLATIEQSVSHATKEFETAAIRVSDRQLVRLLEQKQAVSREVTLELEARASEVRALLQKASNSTLDEFRHRVETQIDLIIAEATERVTSSLASLDAESRVAGEARRRAMEADVARAAEQSTMEFRSGIKAFLYSCLVAAVSAVDEHAQTTLAGLAKDPNSAPLALGAAAGSSSAPENPPSRTNNNNSSSQ